MSDLDRDILKIMGLHCADVASAMSMFGSADVISHDHQAQAAIRFPVLCIGTAIHTMLSSKFMDDHREVDWDSIADRAEELAMKMPLDTCNELWDFVADKIKSLQQAIEQILEEET